MAMGVMDVAAVTRSQDYTTIKQNEDNRAAIGQSAIVQTTRKQEEDKARQVTTRDETAWHKRNPDAKEKGNNEYSGDGGKNRRRGRDNATPIHTVDGREVPTGFDFKV